MTESIISREGKFMELYRFDLERFIYDHVVKRPSSMFQEDMEANKETLSRRIKGKTVLVIGGAGSIGSSFIKAVLRIWQKGTDFVSRIGNKFFAEAYSLSRYG